MVQQLDFSGLVVIVTGSGRGLGEVYANLLASRGANVTITDILPSVHQVAKRITDKGKGKAIAVQGSVTEETDVKKIVDETVKAFGKVTGLINNAGQVFEQNFETMPLEKAKQMMDVHFWGAFNCTRACLPHFKKANFGRVVNITSSTIYGFPEWSIYGAAKAAELSLAKSLAIEWEGTDILINSSAPTGTTESMKANVKNKEALELPQVKSATPERAAALPCFLVHSSSKATGRAFFSGGGNFAEIIYGSSKGVTDPDHTIETVAEAFETGAISKDFKAHASLVEQMGYN